MYMYVCIRIYIEPSILQIQFLCIHAKGGVGGIPLLATTHIYIYIYIYICICTYVYNIQNTNRKGSTYISE